MNNMESKMNSCIPPTTRNPVRADLKVKAVQLDREEELYVTWSEEPGVFYGQLVKRPVEELTDMSGELFSTYNYTENVTPRLYFNDRSYIGSYGVIRWVEDKFFYRVKVLEELPDEIIVRKIDYGNVVTVKRSEILAPVKGMSIFTREPLGITCKLNPDAYNVKMSAKEWADLLTNRNIRVRIVRRLWEDVCQVTFPECPTNQPILDALRKNLEESVIILDVRRNNGAVRDRPAVVNHDELDPSVVSVSSRMQPENFFFNEEETSSNKSCECVESHNRGQQMPIAATRATPYVKYPEHPHLVSTASLFNLDDANEQIGLITATPAAARPQQAPPAKARSAEVVVSYAESPGKFWVHLKHSEWILDEIKEEFLELEGDRKDSFNISKPAPGELYAAIHPVHGTWCRARFHSVNSGGMAATRFVDFGDFHQVPLKNFRSLPQSLNTIPPMAIECCLSPALSWSQKAVQHFVKTCSSEIVYRAVFGLEQDREGVFVQLVTALVDEISKVNLVDVLSSMMVTSTNFVDAVDMHHGGQQAPPEEEETRHLTVTYSPGQVLSNKALVVNVASSFAVWLQLDPSSSEAVTESVSRYVAKPEFKNLAPLRPKIGIKCLAFFLEDGQWYRGLVESVDSVTHRATIHLIDFGHEASVHPKDLRPLPAHLDPYPGLAIKCALDGADRLPGAPLHQCKELLTFRSVSVTVVKMDAQHLFVRLHDNNYGSDLNQILGFPTTTNILPAEISTLSISDEEVYVSHVEAPNIVWIQKKEHVEDINQIEKTLADEEKRSDFRGEPIVGEIYAAKHEPTTKWLRARILKVEGPCAFVRFLDVGDVRWVESPNEILLCPSYYKHIPPFAVKHTFRSGASSNSNFVKVRNALINCNASGVCHAVFSHHLRELLQVETPSAPGGPNVGNHNAANRFQ